MSGVATAITAVAALTSTGYQIYAGNRNARAQRQQMSEQQDVNRRVEERAENQANESRQRLNRANQRAPDVSSILQSRQRTGTGNTANTRASQNQLTSLLSLAGNSLLGQ